MPNSRASSSSSGGGSFWNGRSAASSSSWNRLSAASSALRAQMGFQQRSQTTAYVPSRAPTNTASITNVQPSPGTYIGWHGPLPNPSPWSRSFVYTNPHAPFNPMLPNFQFPNYHDQTMPEVSPPPTSPTRAGQGEDWSSRQMQLSAQMRPPQNSQTLAYTTTQSIDDISINIDPRAVSIPPTPRAVSIPPTPSAEQKTNRASRDLPISRQLVSQVPPPPTSSAQTTGRWRDWISRGSSISQQQLVSQVPPPPTSSAQTTGQYTDWASPTKHWSRDKGKGKKA